MINLIQVYALIADKDEDEIEELLEVFKVTKSREIYIIMRHWNAKVGEQACDDVMEYFGFGAWNEHGESLIVFCMDRGIFVTNTFFQLPKLKHTLGRHQIK